MSEEVKEFQFDNGSIEVGDGFLKIDNGDDKKKILFDEIEIIFLYSSITITGLTGRKNIEIIKTGGEKYNYNFRRKSILKDSRKDDLKIRAFEKFIKIINQRNIKVSGVAGSDGAFIFSLVFLLASVFGAILLILVDGHMLGISSCVIAFFRSVSGLVSYRKKEFSYSDSSEMKAIRYFSW